MNSWLYLIFITSLTLVACRATNSVAPTNTTNQPQLSLKPEWVSKRPMDYQYYIGIGIASKINQLNYQQIAKKNALEDLVSEIRVKIEGSTMLHQIDQNDKFREVYQSHVRSIISESIQDFEVVDSWENENEYWVYYRLSKEKYEYEKRIKKEAAVKSAQDFFVRGNAEQEAGSASNAVDYYLQAIQTIKDKNGVSYDLLLENEISGAIKNLISQINIKFELQELKVQRGFYHATVVPAIVTYKSKTGKEFVGSNLVIKGFFQEGKEEAFLTTDQQGKVYFSLASLKNNGSQLFYKVQLAGTTISFKNNNTNFFTGSSAVFSLAISITKPTICIDYPGQDRIAGEHLKKWFIEKGFTLVKSIQTADLICTLESEERTSEFNDLYTSYLTTRIRMYTSANEEKLLIKVDEVKGVHLNKETARQGAYKNLAEGIEKSVYPKLDNFFMF